MHEVALAEGVLRIVMDAARSSAAARVHTVWVELGALAHVEPDALAFCFDAVTRGSIAEGATARHREDRRCRLVHALQRAGPAGEARAMPAPVAAATSCRCCKATRCG